MDLNNSILAQYKETQATVDKALSDLKKSETELGRIIAESNKAILENKPVLERIEIEDRMDKVSAEFSKFNNERIKALQNLKVLVS